MSARIFRWQDGNGYPLTPKPVSASPFSYGPKTSSPDRGQDVFEMDGIAHATAEDLRLFFARGKLPEGKPPMKKWFTTQLQLYGIPWKKSARLSDLRDALEEALHAGKCNALAPSVAIVYDRLQAKYNEAFKRLEDQKFADITGGCAEEANSDPPRFLLWDNEDELVDAVKAVPGLAILKRWSTAFVGWETTMGKGIENEFARLESFYNTREDIHSAQANVDLELFVRKYLGIDMNNLTTTSGTTRPSAPVILNRWQLQNPQIPELIISKSPDLYMEEFGTATVIGWDTCKVADEIEHLKAQDRQQQEQEEAEAKAERDRKEVEKRERWERRCKGHRELLARTKGRPKTPLRIEHLHGSYLVQWNGGDGGHFNDPFDNRDVMKLNIFPTQSSHGVKASFHIGLYEGTMLLAMTRKAVELLRDEQPKDDPYNSWDGSDGDGNEREDVDNTQANGRMTGKKRPLGEIADPWGVQAARAKRQMLSCPEEEKVPANRIYFQFVCNEIDGYPIVDDRNQHIGHFDFDDTGLAAKGVLYLPRHFGDNEGQSLSIFKRAEKPDQDSDSQPRPWYIFDGRS